MFVCILDRVLMKLEAKLVDHNVTYIGNKNHLCVTNPPAVFCPLNLVAKPQVRNSQWVALRSAHFVHLGLGVCQGYGGPIGAWT